MSVRHRERGVRSCFLQANLSYVGDNLAKNKI
jgi:hypothetical protein